MTDKSIQWCRGKVFHLVFLSGAPIFHNQAIIEHAPVNKDFGIVQPLDLIALPFQRETAVLFHGAFIAPGRSHQSVFR